MYFDIEERKSCEILDASVQALANSATPLTNDIRALYERLAHNIPTTAERRLAANFLRETLDQSCALDEELPNGIDDLSDWMTTNSQRVHAQYQAYLAERKGGSARRYFASRAHALYFLRNVAPTKLVDGAWLYGLCRDACNVRLSDLVTTYVEELGNGDPAKNHVTLYRGLLSKYGLEPIDDLPDALFKQGLVQLALGWNAEDFLPEIIGFNLAYEQLPLHLLITAYELNELGIDPYYFTLHVTVDNADTGHAKRACSAARDAAPRLDDGGAYWSRVRAGAKLASVGVNTLDVINSFDINSEVVEIFARKSAAGSGAHSNFCKVAGRSVNDWLAGPDKIADFLQALEKANWIVRNRPVNESRFWALLEGERAEMFGVFSPYELQVIHDWIRGDASADGAPYAIQAVPVAQTRRMSFRVAERLRAAKSPAKHEEGPSLDMDLAIFEERFPRLEPAEKTALLVQAMSPAMHWTPVGLLATKLFLGH